MLRRFAPLLVLVLLAAAGPAAAQGQPPNLVELSTGSTGSATAQYVALRATDRSQLDGARLTVEDSQGNPLADFADFTSPGPVDSSGYVLVASADAVTVYGINPLVLADHASLPAAGGRLCLSVATANLGADGGTGADAGVDAGVDAGTGADAGVDGGVDGGTVPMTDVDCVAWGQYTGSNGSWGSPVVAGGVRGTALLRIAFTGTNVSDWQNTTPNPALYQPIGPVDGGVGDGGAADAGAGDGGVADAGGGIGTQPGPVPGGDGKVPLGTSGCSATATGSGGMLALGLLLAGLGLVALRRRRAVDPPEGRR